LHYPTVRSNNGRRSATARTPRRRNPSGGPGTPKSDARSKLLTFLGDVVLPSGGSAWLGAITEAMQSLDIDADATMAALRELVEANLVEPRRVGKLAVYDLTAAGRRRLEEAADRIYQRRSLSWDGRWRLLSFAGDDATDPDAVAALERELTWLGYGRLDSGLRVCPWDLGARLDAVLAKHGVTGTAEHFTSELDGDNRALAAEAYDLEELREAHGEFIERFAPALEQDAPSGPEALRKRLELVHEWRKFLFIDPGLPRNLLPPDWQGDRAADVFRELYAAYEQAAWAEWDRVAAAADPDGAAPRRVRSNLDLPVPAGSSGNGSLERRTEEFRERLAAGHKVEVGDWMPEHYRKVALKFIEMHANSELMGALPEREWIARAPSLRRKRSLAAKVQDEVGHAHLIYRVAETLGRPRQAMYEDLIAGRGKFHNVFHYPTRSWGDVACIGFLVDGAAIVTQRALLETSYAPYVRVMRRVVAEESLHYRHGEDILLALASGSDTQFAMLQEAVDRWWEPIMHFFGTDVAAEDDPMIHWGVKARTNEESRQEWLNTYVPKMWDLGIELPDPELEYDADAKRWRYTEPDWDKLAAIVKGEPTEATATRRYWRQLLHHDHRWIHEIVTGDRVPQAA
jgi:ring-1,2-phenylacetyl-CoA epoxidase subunit PaaA